MKATGRDHEIFMFIFDEQRDELITTIPFEMVDKVIDQVMNGRWPMNLIDLNETMLRRVNQFTQQHLTPRGLYLNYLTWKESRQGDRHDFLWWSPFQESVFVEGNATNLYDLPKNSEVQ
ncbi:hypothetical protein P9112_009999 [Eukaryota sp. TZLM1-RC]